MSLTVNNNKAYVLVEFLNDKKKECAIVPLIWLIDDRKRCYWPKTRSQQVFDKLVLDNTPFDSTWMIYKVHRVLKISCDYSVVTKFMNLILEDGSTEDNELDSTEVEISQKKVDESDNEDNEDNEEENTSDSSDSDEAEGSSSKNKQNIDELNGHASLRQETDAGTIMFQQQVQDVIQRLEIMFQQQVQDVIQRLEKLTVLYEQKNACTSQVSQNIQSSSTPTSKPDGLPDLPLKSYDDFKKLEEFLSEQTVDSEGREVPAPAYIYLKERLSIINGADLKANVMNMLKFIITNELAMTYTWRGKGQKKRSFKTTKLCEVITDVVKMQFKGNNLADQCIKHAIQSWLYQAKNRHTKNYNANTKKN